MTIRFHLYQAQAFQSLQSFANGHDRFRVIVKSEVPLQPKKARKDGIRYQHIAATIGFL
ncbi:hypothetical protein [Bifidobacterium pseudolongum]|uniref:hypothetical protein n=1 Tax=Bifidobacterium pseudolongum TaxID=1694 RepID=UPI0013EE9CF4|nr:hypothetical protein [Bifidobacterium pseudolongum]